jgi:hypothetical protein
MQRAKDLPCNVPNTKTLESDPSKTLESNSSKTLELDEPWNPFPVKPFSLLLCGACSRVPFLYQNVRSPEF